MKMKFITIALATLCTGLASPAQADWGELWEETKTLSKKAWDAAQREWNELADNLQLEDAFGLAVSEDSALVGRFYDLKHPIDGKARPMHRQGVVDLIHKFNNKEWDQEIFKAYYSPKVKLYAPYFYLPRCKASYGPEAFQCNENLIRGESRVKPTAWVVVYRGVVTAPKSGSFRFVGMGDDTLLVRFNNKLVLESGWSVPTHRYFDQGTHRSYQYKITQPTVEHDSPDQQEITTKTVGRAIYQYAQTPHWNRNLGGIPSGIPFTVEKGKKYPIEILVSEVPGNEFGFCLLVQELEDPTNPPFGIIPPNMSPTFHLFRTSDASPNPDKIREALTANGKDYTINDCKEGPPFLEKSLIWKADFSEAEKRGIFDRLFGKLTGEQKDTAMGTSTKEKEKEEKKEKEEDLFQQWKVW